MSCPTALRNNIRTGNIKEVERLLKGAPDAARLINEDYAQDCILQSCTPTVGNAFYYSGWRCKPDITELLLQYGADPHSTGIYDESTLHLAARCNQLQIIKLLLENKADLWATDDLGRSVLHSAARSPYNTTEVINYLFDVMKDRENAINTKDFSEKTPLHEATIRGTPSNVRALLQLGADPQATCSRGSTPLIYALQRRNVVAQEIQTILLEFAKDSNYCQSDPNLPPRV